MFDALAFDLQAFSADAWLFDGAAPPLAPTPPEMRVVLHATLQKKYLAPRGSTSRWGGLLRIGRPLLRK